MLLVPRKRSKVEASLGLAHKLGQLHARKDLMIQHGFAHLWTKKSAVGQTACS